VFCSIVNHSTIRLMELPGLLSTGNSAMSAPIAVCLGAVPGALIRYYLTIWFLQKVGTNFPYGTFVINLSGTFMMGLFTTLTLQRVTLPFNLQLMVTAGFLGSYTTFSTYMLDTSNLLRTRKRVVALFYWAGSAVLGWLSLEAGSCLARMLP